LDEVLPRAAVEMPIAVTDKPATIAKAIAPMIINLFSRLITLFGIEM